MTWEPIDCTQTNGIITGYTVEFLGAAGEPFDGVVRSRTFFAYEIDFDTAYTFRVAGINVNGTGPFSESIFIEGDKGK